MICEHIKKAFKQLFTEPDNQTFCPVRMLAVLGSLEFLGLGIANFIKYAKFDAQSFAVGFGALLGGVGVALGMKKDTPKQ